MCQCVEELQVHSPKPLTDRFLHTNYLSGRYFSSLSSHRAETSVLHNTHQQGWFCRASDQDWGVGSSKSRCKLELKEPQRLRFRAGGWEKGWGAGVAEMNSSYRSWAEVQAGSSNPESLPASIFASTLLSLESPSLAWTPDVAS